jgi:anti-sigma28 factor (negative regulator of flagellin synthesis)
MEDIKNEARLEEKIEIIKEAIKLGTLSVEQIAKICHTTVEFVEQIKNS